MDKNYVNPSVKVRRSEPSPATNISENNCSKNSEVGTQSLISYNVLFYIKDESSEIKEVIVECQALDKLTAYEEAQVKIQKSYNYSLEELSTFENSSIQESTEVLTLDADETNNDIEDTDELQESIYPYDIDGFDLDITESHYSIFEYVRQLDKGKLEIQPDFQRNLVWKQQQKCRYIESILLNFPLPPIYLNQKHDTTYSIIDGLQRTTTVDDFLKDKFPLSDLQVLTRFNKTKDKEFRFSDLPSEFKARIEDKKILVLILKPSTPPSVIYDLFNRINTGGTQLNRQEIRHCIFKGKSTVLLKELSEQSIFFAATDKSVRSTRMKDREFILRYIAFRWLDFTSIYDGHMSEFLEKMMLKINGMSDGQIHQISDDFIKVMTLSYELFEKANFRIPRENNRGTINTAIMESVCYYLSAKEGHIILQNQSIIRENFLELLKDSVYIDAVTKSTASKSRVLNRFQRVSEVLEKGLNGYDNTISNRKF